MEYIGKFIGHNVYIENNKLTFEFNDKNEMYDFLSVVTVGGTIKPSPSIADIMLYNRERRNSNEQFV